MPTQLQNLPQLTPDQANVVANMISAYGSLASIAINAGFEPGVFLDLVESPEVQAHLAAARRASTTRARQRLADAAHAAADVLESIVLDENHDKTERRRAATTILRALRRPVRPSRGRGDLSQNFDHVVATARDLTAPIAADLPNRTQEPAGDPVAPGHQPLHRNGNPQAPSPKPLRPTVAQVSDLSPAPSEVAQVSGLSWHNRRPTERAPPRSAA